MAKENEQDKTSATKASSKVSPEKMTPKETKRNSNQGKEEKKTEPSQSLSPENTNTTVVVVENQKKKSFTLLHVLFLVQLICFVGALYRAMLVSDKTPPAASSLAWYSLVVIVLVLWTVWTVTIGYRARRYNSFVTRRFLHRFPIFVLSVPVMVLWITAACWQWDTVTTTVLLHTPRKALVAIQALRVLAVGSLLKWSMGIFPTPFAWFTAFPDMLYGLSAIAILIMSSSSIVMDDDWLFALWNLVGFLLIVPMGAMVHQLGLPPTQLYVPRVSNAVVMEYPMVLGPASVVPTFVSWNLIVAVWVLTTTSTTAATTA